VTIEVASLLCYCAACYAVLLRCSARGWLFTRRGLRLSPNGALTLALL